MKYDLEADVRIILGNQHQSGAYVASPGYAQYPYCWLRDGSFIAHAMDATGEHESARRFHHWVAKAIGSIAPDIKTLISARIAGQPVDHDRMPPARFTLSGTIEADNWPNFQVDGYGQWLWSLTEHITTTRDTHLPAEVWEAARTVANYLELFWNEPCFDAWEEGRTQLHTSTLASAWAGLRAASETIDERYASAAGDAKRFILDKCVTDRAFGKGVRNSSVDASVLWLSTPFGLVEDADPTFGRTLDRLERELVSGGGVLRYPEDTFYGGGAWILLTAWLAWHHARHGRPERAEPYLDWIERQRDADGALPEQVPVAATDPWFLRYWTERWGTPAHPLLWSHAMTILAWLEIERGSSQGELQSQLR